MVYTSLRKNVMRTLLFVLCLLINNFLVAQTISSPAGVLSFKFQLTGEGTPTYVLSLGCKQVILQSKLGITLKDQVSLEKEFVIESVDSTIIDDTWEPVWGEVKRIRNHFRQMTVILRQPKAGNRTLVLVFRLFDDGLGFRYEFPMQENLHAFIVSDERTEFRLTGDHTAFWIPGDYDSNEYRYTKSKLSEVDAATGNEAHEISTRSIIGRNAVQTPLMLKSVDGLYINIHEAALRDYPAMDLLIDSSRNTLTSHLVPDAVGNKAYLQTPCHTPWRTIIVSKQASDILASKLILNLNEPCRLKDVSWIKPQKFIGIWWEMHVGISTWSYSDDKNVKLEGMDWTSVKPGGKHGATTVRTKRYIDFAAANGIDAVLVEGWNTGWEDWFGAWKEEVFDFVTPYPDFHVAELQNYAESKGVKLLMHHETSASVTNYERRMDEAYRFMKDHGYDAVKTGYVGRIIPRGEHHDGQWMVNHYERVARKTAEYKIMLDAHEPVRPTGLQRTYPNWLACEAARGNEFNAWSVGNPPDHETILPFTRLMGGPMDYTPGIFQLTLDYFIPGKKERVHTTLAKQLALYVTMYSPLQMAADLPETYERFMDAFQFIKDVAVDWDDTKIIEAEPGDFLTIARKVKNRSEWFIGAITDEQARISSISLSFLEPAKEYVATCYCDAPDADWKKNPMAYTITSYLVNAHTNLHVQLAAGGGAAVSLRPASEEDLKRTKRYGNGTQ